MNEWRRRSFTASVVGVLLATVCVGEVRGRAEDEVEVVALSALVPVLLTEVNHLGMARFGPVGMTSDNPDEWYTEPTTMFCDDQVKPVEAVADDDMYVYLGDGGDYLYLDEWATGERVAEAEQRYSFGLAALEDCVDSGALAAVATSYPGIDEAHRFEDTEDDNSLYTVLYARNGGVIILLKLLAARHAYSDEQVERMVGTALGRLAMIGRVEVADSAAGGQPVAPTGVLVTLPPLAPTPPEASNNSAESPITTSGEQVAATSAAASDQAPDSTLVADETVAAALLTVGDFPGEWESSEPEVGNIWADQQPFTYCAGGHEMAVMLTRGYVWLIPAWTGVYDPSLSDDLVSETVDVFASPEDIDTWFAGAESCVGREFGSAGGGHAVIDRFDVPDVGDEGRGFRFHTSQGELPAQDEYVALVRVGSVLVMVHYLNNGPDPYQPNQAFFDELVKAAVSKVEAALTGDLLGKSP